MMMDDNPTILQVVAWKRRSGFAKYSDSVGVGSSWERRRLVLTTSQLKYFSASSESSEPALENENKPRGVLDIAPERATIIATFPAESSKPTPYALSITISDGADNWKLCFDNRETQLIWQVALTDIIAGASAREYTQDSKEGLDTGAQNAGGAGFRRLYEEGEGRLLDLVQNALHSANKTMQNEAQEDAETEAIEVVEKSLRPGLGVSIRMLSPEIDSTSTPAPSPKKSPKVAESKEVSFDDDHGKKTHLPDIKLYQSLTVVAIAFVFDRLCSLQSSLLWQLVSAVVLCICFLPEKPSDGKKKERAYEDSALNKSEEVNVIAEMNSTVGAELMKAEGVPLSPTMGPSISEPRIGTNADDDRVKHAPTHRLEPLTEDEMESNLHQRWAMSAPTVNLSGQSWTLIADPAFKTEYSAYLKQLGFSAVTRRVACSLIARTTETTEQSGNGRELYLKGTNPKGAWERTLTASGFPDFETLAEHKEGEDYLHTKKSIMTADSEEVIAEAWWEEGGTKHRSWLRGGKKYGGGDFESLRYLEEGSDGNVLVCESFFWPKDASKEKAVVTWRFKRDD